MSSFEASIGFQTDQDQTAAAARVRECLETHPSLSLILDYVVVGEQITPPTRLDHNRHLVAKLRSAEQAASEYKTKFEAVALQLQKLAEHKGPAFVPETGALLGLQERNQSLLDQLREAEKRVAFLEGVKQESAERFSAMREQIWAVQTGIAPEIVALTSERDFWRAKAMEALKRG